MVRSFHLVIAVVLGYGTLLSAAPDVMTFRVKGANPGGVGGYTGDVTVTKLGKHTANVHWVSGTKKQVTDGFAVKTDKAIGTAYGAGLYALAVCELQGKHIHATWSLASKPQESGTYELKGSAYEGSLSFADDTAGSVTFTPKKNGLYKVIWDLQSGRYEGIGLRVGDVLVAASGDAAAGFGVGAYTFKGEVIEGQWAAAGSEAPGTETWTLPASTINRVATGDGLSIEFGGESYGLRENKSAPGQVTSELREYLRKGEDWDGYSKMVGLRMQNVKTDAASLARSTLDQVQKKHPGSYVKELEMSPDKATILFILVTGDDAELNIFRYQKAGPGIASAQFVMRNKPPYDTQKKFKAEQDKEWDKWIEDLKSLAGDASALLAATAGKAVPESQSPSATKKSGDDVSPELVKAVKADLDKCAALAQKFMNHVRAGNTEKAIALMSDGGFSKITREQFLETVEKSNGIMGPLKSYRPDKGATDFGVKNGVMTFTLQSDAEYANGTTRETLTFIRNDQGLVEFIGYNRTAKN
jgi:hypothetical protein